MNRPTTRAALVTDRTSPRNICAVVSPAEHAGFGDLAKARGVTKAELLRQLIAGAVRDPTAAFDLAEPRGSEAVNKVLRGPFK